MSADAEAEAEAFNDFLTVLLEEISDEINLPLEEVKAKAVIEGEAEVEAEGEVEAEIEAESEAEGETKGEAEGEAKGEAEGVVEEGKLDDTETENSTCLESNNTEKPENTGNGNEKKKRSRRGTRGKGRKINYKKFQDNKAGRSAAEAVERPPEDAETENSTPLADKPMVKADEESEPKEEIQLLETETVNEQLLNEVKAKKKVRRGTRGRGRKINYKQVEDKEAEQNGGRKELTDAKASRDQRECQTERKPQTHTRVWTRRDRACESGWRGPAHCDQRDRRVPRRSAQETPSHAGA
ncbi:retinitis pigmentosa 1-like 1 protein isoform X1 [Pangasianodon hypophthalmus]|uniref:retinitis pigmentosa 1-like 1 protein isoform X1 n=1 Tax=Pangasianodon hypophthalmus TaxID=310915 RepID=UPI0023075BA0|nr:retinitis pigmentosa 1-like 1 protein isoform X1 [Pangasianodon hypophthalmus]XP_053097090.1 retinitis pigmentosa 1-like 1 protein isoform X1 [Pangasianodon hypophthalmus]